MSKLSLPVSVLQKILPRQMESFLVRQGFRRVSDGQQRDLSLWTQPISRQRVLVPTSADNRDYGLLLLGVIEYFQNESRSPEDVLAEIVLGPCDVHRYGFEDVVSVWGLATASALSDVSSGIIDFWKFSAAGYLTRRDQYAGVPAGAAELIQESRFGQTGYGSYRLKLYTPVLDTPGDIEAPLAFAEGATRGDFSNAVIDAVYANIRFLATRQGGARMEGKPATLNRNVVSAAAKMFPQSVEQAKLESVRMPVQVNATEPDWRASVSLSHEAHYQIRVVTEYFEDRLDFISVKGEGYVVGLNRDRPGTSGDDLVRRIVIEVSVRGIGWRKVQVHLDPMTYQRAVTYHKKERLVRIAGLVDKKTLPWTLTDMKAFEPVLSDPEDEPSLFDD